MRSSTCSKSVPTFLTTRFQLTHTFQAFGFIFGLSDAIIGLTIFAMGNSLADLVANMSVAVCRQIWLSFLVFLTCLLGIRTHHGILRLFRKPDVEHTPWRRSFWFIHDKPDVRPLRARIFPNSLCQHHRTTRPLGGYPHLRSNERLCLDTALGYFLGRFLFCPHGHQCHGGAEKRVFTISFGYLIHEISLCT